MTSPPPLDPLRRLAGMLALEAEIRKAGDLKELILLMANDTRRVVIYRQAALLVREGKNRWRWIGHSDVDLPATSAPYGDWLCQ
ncbi:MAG: hypothetical protein G8345_21245, partial [Magnetococcales bacterium]|nr:hypothetical protein [Magnetococcales bacterium]